MDEISTRAIIIGVGLFVTMTIVTLFIATYTQVQNIYGIVINTNNSIYDMFSDIYSMYSGKTENGIGLLNTIKQYEKDTKVVIEYINSESIRSEVSSMSKQKEADYLKNIMEANEIANSNVREYNRNIL